MQTLKLQVNAFFGHDELEVWFPTGSCRFQCWRCLLPFGAHKGYALSVMIELVASLLAGTVPASSPDYKHLASPTVITAWSVDVFMPLDRFVYYVDELSQRVKSSEPAEGFDEVILPGEYEARNRAIRSKSGIPMPVGTWNKLLSLAGELGVSLPDLEGVTGVHWSKDREA